MTNLLNIAEERRLALTGNLDASLGQHFTPAQAAELIASMPRCEGLSEVRILDPGAGSGSLFVALVDRLLRAGKVRKIEIVAVELDDSLAPHLDSALEDCRSVSESLGVACTVQRVSGDFIHMAAGADAKDLGLFDIVILNPPYGKIAASSDVRSLLRAQGVEAVNLYAAFVALGIQRLKDGGQLVAITPRSWANGSYFSQFRKWLFKCVSLDTIHIFDSRNTVFAATKVLQETIIFSVTKGIQSPNITISTSVAHLDEPNTRTVEAAAVLHPSDPQMFVRIPGDTGGEIERAMDALPCTMADLGVKVSTGKVVDFRSRNNLHEIPRPEHHPLIYPVNFDQGRIVWPTLGKKSQGFSIEQETDRKLLMPPGDYVVIKRFSAKEERRRIVAAVWEDNGLEPAFENHLNVINAGGKGLDRALAEGLCWWLNSTFVDNWFRTFSGHTQVNAGDLRTLKFPVPARLRELGRSGIPEQAVIDQTVDSLWSEEDNVAV